MATPKDKVRMMAISEKIVKRIATPEKRNCNVPDAQIARRN